MDASQLTFKTTDVLTDFNNLVGAIKLARAKALRRGGADEMVVVHRRFEGDHVFDWRECWCNPVKIAQDDYRTSAYFAHKILYPVLH